MTFRVNTSPFAGREGNWAPPASSANALYKELEANVALQVEDTADADTFVVSGRGELHLAILIETMRREGYEFQVSRPEVIIRRTRTARRWSRSRNAVIDVAEELHGHGHRDAG